MDVKYLELDFEQSLNMETDRTILAVARERTSGRLRLFRISDATGEVNLYCSGWRRVGEPESHEVINRLVSAWHREIPAYTIN
ncbi:MAG: hypothetical protein MJA29_14090 [Candidatus Omnitrophica bacterium]|nr:hypothetical protein [Candidatus Omnitrophota bacterium]